jgi:hypothetical protein
VLTFLALVCVAVAISGVLAFLFFWPMALVHLRERHPACLRDFGGAAFVSPPALRWLLAGRYRKRGDPGLNGLCAPAQLALWSVIVTLVAAAGLTLTAEAFGI